MNTYKFKINAVDCEVNQNGNDNVVFNVHWSFIGEDENGNTASMIGVQGVEHNPEGEFIAFDDLTEEIVIGWIEPLMNVEAFKGNIDNQLSEIAAPTKITLQLPSQSDTIA